MVNIFYNFSIPIQFWLVVVSITFVTLKIYERNTKRPFFKLLLLNLFSWNLLNVESFKEYFYFINKNYQMPEKFYELVYILTNISIREYEIILPYLFIKVFIILEMFISLHIIFKNSNAGIRKRLYRKEVLIIRTLTYWILIFSLSYIIGNIQDIIDI